MHVLRTPAVTMFKIDVRLAGRRRASSRTRTRLLALVLPFSVLAAGLPMAVAAPSQALPGPVMASVSTAPAGPQVPSALTSLAKADPVTSTTGKKSVGKVRHVTLTGGLVPGSPRFDDSS